MSRPSNRQRVLAIITAFAMITVICGFTARGFSAHASQSDHCDWSMHFTGVAGAAPVPVPATRPVRATWLRPSPIAAVPRRARRARAHLARAPPLLLRRAIPAA
jgi:hypothetical protein